MSTQVLPSWKAEDSRVDVVLCELLSAREGAGVETVAWSHRPLLCRVFCRLHALLLLGFPAATLTRSRGPCAISCLTGMADARTPCPWRVSPRGPSGRHLRLPVSLRAVRSHTVLLHSCSFPSWLVSRVSGSARTQPQPPSGACCPHHLQPLPDEAPFVHLANGSVVRSWAFS